MTTRNDEIVGVIGISRLKEPCGPPDPAMPVETRKSFESTVGELQRRVDALTATLKSDQRVWSDLQKARDLSPY